MWAVVNFRFVRKWFYYSSNGCFSEIEKMNPLKSERTLLKYHHVFHMTYLKRQLPGFSIAPARNFGTINVVFTIMLRVMPYKNINILLSLMLYI